MWVGMRRLSPCCMQPFGSYSPPDYSNGHAMIDSHPIELQPTKQRRSAAMRYGGFLGKIVPRISRRPLGIVDIVSSRSRRAPTRSISSLAPATLVHIGFPQALRTHWLPEAVDFSLATSKFSPTVSGISNRHQQPSEQLILPPSLNNILNRSSFGPSLAMLVSTLPQSSFGSEEQESRIASESHPGFVVDSGASHPPMSSVPVTPVLPGTHTNAASMLSHETNGNVHPSPIPLHMRSQMRPPTRSGSIFNTTTHNHHRLLGVLPNPSASSLLTIASYITAPTSPPPSIRSLPRCESPAPMSIPQRRIRVQSFQTSSLRYSVIPDDEHFEDAYSLDGFMDQNHIPDKPRSPISNASSISNSPSRKILIIGSSYKNHEQVKKMFSFETLDGAVEDRNQLKSCFKARSYSVETLFERGFNRKHALARVAQFLEGAERGDVRAIVFTGHGYTDGNGMVSLVPPECSEKSEVITRAEWDQNIREHSHPGVVVFSIMAHCFSGDVMKQELDRQSWDAPSTTNENKDAPIFLTFAASDKTAYESLVTRDPSLQPATPCDHFIYALISAIHSIDVETGTWSQFFEEFEWHFRKARSCASWQDKQHAPETPNWRSSNLQTPRFSASGLIRLSVVF